MNENEIAELLAENVEPVAENVEYIECISCHNLRKPSEYVQIHDDGVCKFCRKGDAEFRHMRKYFNENDITSIKIVDNTIFVNNTKKFKYIFQNYLHLPANISKEDKIEHMKSLLILLDEYGKNIEEIVPKVKKEKL